MKACRILAVLLPVILLGCSKQQDASVAEASPASSAARGVAAESAAGASQAPPPFDSSRAMQYVKEIVAFGPRPTGSETTPIGRFEIFPTSAQMTVPRPARCCLKLRTSFAGKSWKAIVSGFCGMMAKNP